MVLELKVPESANLEALKPLLPVLISYIISFMAVWIYWNNHHHLFMAVRKVNGNVLLANGNLLFWLSLAPFVTGWMGKSNFAPWPVFFFGCVMLAAGASWVILAAVLVKLHGKKSQLAKALGTERKGQLSFVLYAVGVALALFYPLVAVGLYTLISVLWLIPDKRIERTLDIKN
jgi:uncharacterized membrane protein